MVFVQSIYLRKQPIKRNFPATHFGGCQTHEELLAHSVSHSFYTHDPFYTYVYKHNPLGLGRVGQEVKIGCNLAKRKGGQISRLPVHSLVTRRT